MSAGVLRLASALLLPAMAATAARAADEPPPLLTLWERTERGKLVEYPPSSVVDVDVNSAIRLVLSREALAGLTFARPSQPDERAEVVQQIRKLSKLQKDLNAAARAVLEASRLRAGAGNVALAGASLTRYTTAHAQLAKAYEELRAYMGDERHDDLVREALAARVDQAVAASRFVANEHRRLQERVQQDLDDAPGRVLTVTASIGNPPRQLHVPGYDDLTTGPARTIDKTRFTFDERFAEEYAAAQALARDAADWNRLRDAALAAVRRKLDEIQSSLEGFAKQAESLAGQAAHEATPEVRELAKQIAEAGKMLRAAHADASPALKDAVAPPAGADPAALLAAVVTALEKAVPKVRQAAGLLLDAVPVLQRASTAVSDAGAKLAAQVADLVSGALGSVFVASKAPLPAAFPSTRVRLAAASDTEVSLLVADRADGDVVTIAARVYDSGPDGEEPVPGGETTRYLRVRARGIVADTGAVVLFTRGLKHSPGAFVPAAGAFAVLRFKGYRGAREAGSSFWHYVAPGLGVSAIAIPRSADGSTQIAWMGTFHLFGDVLQASLGTTTDAAPVWGIGLGLHRIAGLGKYFQ